MTDGVETKLAGVERGNDGVLSLDVPIQNKKGLHARASAKFVQCAEQFDADIRVSKDGSDVAGTSIMGLMMLAAATGSTIHISAKGNSAEEALEALVSLVNRKFDEDE